MCRGTLSNMGYSLIVVYASCVKVNPISFANVVKTVYVYLEPTPTDWIVTVI